MISAGFHQMTFDTYHALETPTPVLSSSIARTLLGQSPWHAWYQHPVLNPTGQREHKEIFDIGTAAHAYILEGSTAFVIVDAKDWKTKAAQDARDAAYAAGRVPLLAERWVDVQAMAAALKEQLSRQPHPQPFTNGKAEQTLVWLDGDVWCKARLDWLHNTSWVIDDLKSTENASPDNWTRRQLYDHFYDLQAAWYLRGVKALTGYDAEFRFVVVETRPPYGACVVALGPDVLTLAEKKCRRALELWHACTSTGVFKGYPERPCYASLPPWHEAQWLTRELRDEGIRDDGRPIEQLLVEGTQP